MEWLQYLLVLLCPLMMIFCMKGHLGGHQNHDKSHVDHSLNKKVHHLEEENKKLQRDLENLSSLVKKDS